MSALQGKLFTFHIYPRHRLRFLNDRLEKLLGFRADFRSAPQLTLVASSALIWIYLDNLQFFLLAKVVRSAILTG
jgi:hypothetical protein